MREPASLTEICEQVVRQASRTSPYDKIEPVGILRLWEADLTASARRDERARIVDAIEQVASEHPASRETLLGLAQLIRDGFADEVRQQATERLLAEIKWRTGR